MSQLKNPAYQKEMWNKKQCGQAWFSSGLFRSNARCRNQASVYKLENGSRMKSLGSEIISQSCASEGQDCQPGSSVMIYAGESGAN